ncbi:protein translocase subunit SecD [Marinospirillum alkaliphilum]|uniref:Protein translocase subunit SecD n=1 Tax=Marinospirillum alkaliphilum DSM 21637 TaxID=1122209 RepID=A0A1K1VZF0_9GAMM|nr:protein translocase subunit SecD [Marinospirillum alkaliphilum]SFX29965.1 preprotein translocase subunit SecD [Marinospirillum alkaliphilum DSM 21637]
MLNRYPLWKNLLILLVIGVGIIYALPNLYPEDPAVQISGTRGSIEVTDRELNRATQALDAAGIEVLQASLENNSVLIRLHESEQQLAAREVIQQTLGDNFVVALNQAPTTPEWLSNIGARGVNLGLDLRGGVHFLMEVDMDAALKQQLEVTASEVRATLRTERLRFRQVSVEEGRLLIRLASADDLPEARRLLQRNLTDYVFEDSAADALLTLSLTEQAVRELEDYAVDQNLITLRNRVNELGVAEPLVQRSGRNRIVVELPGVQDTAAAKRVLGATANLEFRLEARRNADPLDTEEFIFRDQPNRNAALERDIITTGNNVANASVGFDENNRPQVNIRLNGQGGRLMSQATRPNVGRSMGVLFIEHKTRTRFERVDGERVEVREPYTERGIISLATIQSELGSSFRITGVGSIQEASELALLLRAGALAAPIYFVEERTIGPSLGQRNIEQGISSIQIGLALVVIFMLAWYRVFGIFACVALASNLVLLVALLSALGATLTLPGIAGIVLTLGMAVDANVLINARIKEEIYHRGMSPQNAIHAGYEKAFSTILDANITTLLVAVILFSIGTGPVKGFAVTLSLGLLTSMFTAILVTRMQVNWVYGKRRIESLSI